MYPYKIIWDLDLYSILITVGLIACMILIRVLSDKRGLSAKWQNFVLVTMVFTVVIGYGSAVVFQALYNMERDGGFHITKSTGQTFYGGLIGGAVAFLLIYFGVGYPLFRDNEHLRNFPDLMSIAACGVTVAHGFGRLGCLMAGCCYGRATDAWYGIEMVGIGKRIPVQLFEAIFLFLLCGWLVIRYCEGRQCGMPLYMMLYGTWRFFAEYLRDDYRGNSLVSFLTPSQLISLVLAVAGLILLIVEATAERAARLRAERGEAFRAELLAARATAMPDAGAEEQAETPEAVPETAAEPVMESPVDSAAPAEPAPAAPTGQAPAVPAEPESQPSPPAFGVIDVSGIAPAHPIGEESFVRADSFRTEKDFIKPESFRRVPGHVSGRVSGHVPGQEPKA